MLFFLSQTSPAQAQIRPMGDSALDQVYAQSGISITASNIGFDITDDVMYYKDPDGIGGNTTAGVLSLCGIHLKGTADFGSSPLTIDIASSRDASGLLRVTGVSFKLSGMTLKIDNFTIDAIRLGNAPGVGGDLGSFGITNLTAKITGGITITGN